MVVPTGMLRSGSVLPGLIGASEPLTTCVPTRHTLGRNNVTTLAIGIAQQCQMRSAVRIIFQTLDFGRNTILVALEINHAVMLLVAAALMPNGNMAIMVTAGIARLGFPAALHEACPYAVPA